MKFGFAKILRKNESGYSGDRPKQRGEFILVPKSCLKAFPNLSENTLNDQSTIECLVPNGSLIGLNIVYHNAKFFPSHERDHNEHRIYRNKDFDKALDLDRGVLVVFLPLEDEPLGSFLVFSIKKGEQGFEEWAALDGSNFPISQIEEFPRAQEFLSLASDREKDKSISNLSDVVDGIMRINQERAEYTTNTRQQQPAAEDDPSSIISILIKSQDQFKNFLREMYGFKCALRGISLIEGTSAIGLEAAHIQPHQNEGPLLPTNGILLSADLHRVFEAGGITLTLDGKIEVNDKISESSEVRRFNGLIIKPLSKFEMFSPYQTYITYHRENIFAKFKG